VRASTARSDVGVRGVRRADDFQLLVAGAALGHGGAQGGVVGVGLGRFQHQRAESGDNLFHQNRIDFFAQR
jgi:hypothetical protein